MVGPARRRLLGPFLSRSVGLASGGSSSFGGPRVPTPVTYFLLVARTSVRFESLREISRCLSQKRAFSSRSRKGAASPHWALRRPTVPGRSGWPLRWPPGSGQLRPVAHAWPATISSGRRRGVGWLRRPTAASPPTWSRPPPGCSGARLRRAAPSGHAQGVDCLRLPTAPSPPVAFTKWPPRRLLGAPCCQSAVAPYWSLPIPRCSPAITPWSSHRAAFDAQPCTCKCSLYQLACYQTKHQCSIPLLPTNMRQNLGDTVWNYGRRFATKSFHYT